MKSFEQIAKAMYEAYSRKAIFAAAWDELEDKDKEAWIAAAKAAHKEITEGH